MKPNTNVRLLNPGPVSLTQRVRRALLRQDLCHRDTEFASLQMEVRARLARVYSNADRRYAAVLLTGSGTAAVEAMVGSLVPHDGKALVAANGVYGERIASMLHVHGKEYETVRSDWTEPIRLDEVERRLDRDAGFTHVIAVHHETTTGRLNDLSGLGAICRKRGVALLLDAVSSFGGELIDFERWNVEACASTANKCLHGVPGVSFVLVKESVFESRSSGARSIYLDLFRNHEEQCQGRPLFTPAVHVVYALQEALLELEEGGGWRQRRQHYGSLSHALRARLRKQGVRLLLGDERHYSAMLSSFVLPEDVTFCDLRSHLKESGFVVYPGHQALNGTVFRVAVMGDLSRQDIDRFVDAFSAACESLALKTEEMST